MAATRSSETTVLRRSTRRNNSEDGILHSYRGDNLKSDNHVVLVKYSLVKKDALSWCNSQFFVAKFRGEVIAHCKAVAVKRHSSMRNWLFGLPGWIFCEQSAWCERKLWACIDFAFTWLAFIGLGEFGIFHSNTPVRLMLSYLNTCIVIPRVSVSLYPRFAQNLMHNSPSDPSRNCIRPDTRL
jgi:hypothetical protein